MNAHGDVYLCWKNDTLITTVKGPFNKEGIVQSINKIKDSATNKGLKSWRRLTILDTQALASPEVLKIIKKLHHWCEESGCYATALVTANSIQLDTFKKHITHKDTKMFLHIEEAKDWLNKQKYN